MQAQMCIEVKGNTKKNTNKIKCSRKNIRNIFYTLSVSSTTTSPPFSIFKSEVTSGLSSPLFSSLSM